MRIGELAALVGVSTRTVRYYHHLGLLPEPERLPNGYREYRMRDAVRLARVRHLAGLGLSLEELRDALSGDRGADFRGADFREALRELDDDLARQQEAIAARRARLAALLAQPELSPDSMMSPDAADVLRDLGSGGSVFGAFDHELLTLATVLSDEEGQANLAELMRPMTEPGKLDAGHALYRRLDELADAEAGDERVGPLAEEMAAHVPDELAGMVPSGPAADLSWMEAMTGELSPAQAEVLRLVFTKLKERA
ncbi:MerR family transcriptional regulator [Nonomuraea sp. WAC 01424]|uniref:MerR family transcriptional regulator n=1 Tax=Nonomuraea sp. WAC 01424 TaxID=2203200 RepID=UPI000F79E08A|nr:MerR family transcriptional regulator [Nonomuraea sp. WAC 01424]RSN01928.1 MerR family transcriptional regulator [Nonomuraea sp. WAC 01424]